MSKSNEFKDNLKVNNKESKVVATSIFSTKEQEELFFKCAQESLSIKEGLDWNKNEPEEFGKVVATPIFRTKEQEELFFKCAQEAMSTETRLHWDGEQDDER